MEVQEHRIHGISVLEVMGEGLVFEKLQDLLDIVSDYSIKKLIFKKEQITPVFFDLNSGFAAMVLQKARHFHFSIGIVGDFSSVTDLSFRDFMYESTRSRLIVFKQTVPEILRIFCK